MMTEQEQRNFQNHVSAALNTFADLYPDFGFLLVAVTNRDDPFTFYGQHRALRPSEMLAMLALFQSQLIRTMTTTEAP